MAVEPTTSTSVKDTLRAHWSDMLSDAKAALSELPRWERPVHLFWLAGPFILLIERSPADFWLSLLALIFAIRALILREGWWLQIFWVKAALLFWAVCLLAAAFSVMPAYSIGETALMGSSLAATAIVIGAGLAGSEAAWQIANAGIAVKLVEMRPLSSTPAHHTGEFGELVCSNSFGSLSQDRAAGLLQEELRRFNSLIIKTADKFSVPAGGALAVDRSKFSKCLTEVLTNHPLIEIKRIEQLDIPKEETITILATGPLTSSSLATKIKNFTGIDSCHFFDAASPIIYGDTVDHKIVFKASRYDKGDPAYLNCPMNENEYVNFRNQLIEGQQATLKDFEKDSLELSERQIELTYSGRVPGK